MPDQKDFHEFMNLRRGADNPRPPALEKFGSAADSGRGASKARASWSYLWLAVGFAAYIGIGLGVGWFDRWFQ